MTGEGTTQQSNYIMKSRVDPSSLEVLGKQMSAVEQEQKTTKTTLANHNKMIEKLERR